MERTKDFDFNVTLLKYFWNNRDRNYINKPSGIMKQKFLFFYNMFAKINSKKYTITNLKAFKNGPVYYDIFRCSHDELLEQTDIREQKIDDNIANITMTLLYLYKNTISNLTHNLDLWKKVYTNIKDNEINEDDISEDDVLKLTYLYNETKNVCQNYYIFISKYEVPLLLLNKQKNYIINNYYDIIRNYDSEDKCPTYVNIENGELYFD